MRWRENGTVTVCGIIVEREGKREDLRHGSAGASVTIVPVSVALIGVVI